MTTKKLSEETEQKIVNPNSIEVITIVSPSSDRERFIGFHRIAIV